jgi:hypothetical protein
MPKLVAIRHGRHRASRTNFRDQQGAKVETPSPRVPPDPLKCPHSLFNVDLSIGEGVRPGAYYGV